MIINERYEKEMIYNIKKKRKNFESNILKDGQKRDKNINFFHFCDLNIVILNHCPELTKFLNICKTSFSKFHFNTKKKTQ